MRSKVSLSGVNGFGLNFTTSGQSAHHVPTTSSVSIAFHVVSYATTTLPVDFEVIAEVGCYAERDEHPKTVNHLVHSESVCDAARAFITEL